ncbi:MAG: penicillin-binding transpeptidase domain-containing protein [Nocardioides sp.]
MSRLPLALAVLVLAGLPACSAGDSEDTDGAQQAADELAAALTKGEYGNLDDVVAGMDGLGAKVAAGKAAVVGDDATATLTWTWATPGEPWTYDTEVALSDGADGWTATRTPTVVEPSLTEGESLDATTLQARRGDILGAGDEPLVTRRPVVRFGIDKTKVPAARAVASARALATLLEIDPAAYAKLVKAAGPKAFIEALVLREDDAGSVSGAELRAIKGAVALGGELPLAPTREFAAPILGRVGPATAEIVKKSQGAIQPGDEVGLSGLQARYDEQLAGTPGIVVSAIGGKEGSDDRELFSTDEANGAPLRTTLDPRLQTRAEAALAGVGPASAVVAIRPSTGNILAAASGPGSDGYNTATFAQYAPGSTMKVVTALALMRAGVSPTDRVPCTATLTVDGKGFKNYDDYPASGIGDIPLRTAVANSCNTALISQHQRLGGSDLTRAAAALGLGEDHDLGFPAFFGSVPAPASETEKAASLIGQGKVLASPMAMATVAASVVRGAAVVPRLLPDADPVQASPEEPLSAREAAALRDMMRAVVTEGSATFLSDLPGPPIGAKTGTAEFGSGDPLPTHTWMIATQGDLAVAVFVEVGESGSQTAGPILERFLRDAR